MASKSQFVKIFVLYYLKLTQGNGRNVCTKFQSFYCHPYKVSKIGKNLKFKYFLLISVFRKQVTRDTAVRWQAIPLISHRYYPEDLPFKLQQPITQVCDFFRTCVLFVKLEISVKCERLYIARSFKSVSLYQPTARFFLLRFTGLSFH